MTTQVIPTRRGSWRYAIVAGLALAAAGVGAALHWAQTPPPTTVRPVDALADIDPPPSVVREKELKRHIADEGRQPERVANDLLELAELYIVERRWDEALRLFDLEAVRKVAAFRPTGKEVARDREQLAVLSGLGKGIVLAYQDKADESNAEFLRIVKSYPPLLKKEESVPPKLRPDPKGSRGVLEQFFNKATSGPNWKRAVGDAVERNAKNLGDKMPDELKRLRLLPAKSGKP